MSKRNLNIKGMRYLTDIKNILNDLKKSNKRRNNLSTENKKNEDLYDEKKDIDLLSLRIKELELENFRLLKNQKKKDEFIENSNSNFIILKKEKIIDELKNEIKEFQDKIEEMKNENLEMELEKDEILKKLKFEEENDILELENKILENKNEFENLMKNKKDEILELENKILENKNEFENSIKNKKHEILKLENKITNLNNENELKKQKIFSFLTEHSKLKNKILELQGNIQVLIRIRPEKIKSNKDPQNNNFSNFKLKGNSITCKSNKDSNETIHSFDKIYDNINQSDLFQDMNYLLHGFIQGYNICIFAYGQTGSGKTFTITGTEEDPGLIPRSIKHIYEYLNEEYSQNIECEKNLESVGNDNIVSVCNNLENVNLESDIENNQNLFESGNKNYFDDSESQEIQNIKNIENNLENNFEKNENSLFNSTNFYKLNESVHKSNKNLESIENNKNTFNSESNIKNKECNFKLELNVLEIYNETVRDLISNSILKPNEYEQKFKEIKNEKDIFNIIKNCMKIRQTKSTKSNETSSRSHCLYSIKLTQKKNKSKIISNLNFIDLAGSERIKQSQVEGSRLKETQNINKSLLNLRIVFQNILNKSDHIPYRDSKLTHILKNSIENKSKIVMLLNISTDLKDVDETRASLRFGTFVSKIEIGRGTIGVEREIV